MDTANSVDKLDSQLPRSPANQGDIRRLCIAGAGEAIGRIPVRRHPGLSPHKIAGNIGWTYKKVTLGIGGIWNDNTPWTPTYGLYRKNQIKFDANGAFRLTRRFSLYFQGTNLLNQSHEVYQSFGVEEEGGIMQRLGNYGTAWVFGVKGMF